MLTDMIHFWEVIEIWVEDTLSKYNINIIYFSINLVSSLMYTPTARHPYISIMTQGEQVNVGDALAV